MKSVEVIARSVEEAVSKGLTKLGATRDEVEITILDEGNKGFLGIIGSKQAKVKIEFKVDIKWKAQVAEDWVKKLLDYMKIDTVVRMSYEDEENIEIAIYGDNLGLLIGRRGKTLDALQYLVSMIVNRQGGKWVRVIVDVEGYRSRRENTLKALAQRLAAKAQTSGRRVVLDPMTAQERRIIHCELQDFSNVETHSEGREPYRRVIIVPKK
ncbi:MAG: protein jag [Firmicutes bacterium]|nr:protein jag [Bacillota bacterium]